MILARSLVVLAVSFIVAWAATMILIPWLQKQGVLDIPNLRSSHKIPTPRGGGIGIILGLMAGTLAARLLEMRLPGAELFLAAGLIALIGFIDDRSGGVSVLVRFACQFAAAGIVIHGAGGLARLPLPAPLNVSLGVLAIPAALIWIVGLTNLYNFLDGIDGFAGLQGVIAGLSLAFLAPGGLFAAIGFAIAGACAGFLVHNWHPAKVFMGDVGSPTLGFILAALPFQLEPGSRSQAVFVVVICLWFFFSDGVFTFMRRLSRGEKVWEAHRSHLYQRLVRSGLRHNQVALPVMVAAATLAGITIAAWHTRQPGALWGVFAVAVLCFLAYCGWTWSRERAIEEPS
jgi:Fuc2NAc and GlcNAc transferase